MARPWWPWQRAQVSSECAGEPQTGVMRGESPLCRGWGSTVVMGSGGTGGGKPGEGQDNTLTLSPWGDTMRVSPLRQRETRKWSMGRGPGMSQRLVGSFPSDLAAALCCQAKPPLTFILQMRTEVQRGKGLAQGYTAREGQS